MSASACVCSHISNIISHKKIKTKLWISLAKCGYFPAVNPFFDYHLLILRVCFKVRTVILTVGDHDMSLFQG